MNNTKGLQFRNTFRPGDIGQIISLHGVIAHGDFGYDCRLEAYVAEHLGRFAGEDNPKSRIWVVDDNEGIVGTVAIVDAGNDVAQLRWFAVHPRASGKGMGTALLDKALRFCQRQHYEEVFLWTVEGQEIARAMYNKNGFELVEENTHEAWGKTLTEQKMKLLLA